MILSAAAVRSHPHHMVIICVYIFMYLLLPPRLGGPTAFAASRSFISVCTSAPLFAASSFATSAPASSSATIAATSAPASSSAAASAVAFSTPASSSHSFAPALASRSAFFAPASSAISSAPASASAAFLVFWGISLQVEVHEIVLVYVASNTTIRSNIRANLKKENPGERFLLV